MQLNRSPFIHSTAFSFFDFVVYYESVDFEADLYEK